MKQPNLQIGMLERWNRARLQLAETQRGMIAEWTVTVLILLFATTTLAQAFVIPTGSMEDTLLVGDHLLVDKLSYSPAGSFTKHLLPYQDVQRGDIIVFRYPEDIKQTYVKRAIGLPGDHIRIENKQLVLNGKQVAEPYKVHKTGYIDSYRDNFPSEPLMPLFPGGRRMLRENVQGGELVVPAGAIFALGDNRDESEDSRYWGFVPRENIVGKPLIIYWSYESTRENLSGSPINPDHLKDLALNFFTKTRWDRSFQLVRGYPLQ
ncbi:signal peptidase I [Bryobacter aggregatus]|uniref:signal peptidase I n=1 Tax=Bryobacter aggregatus TaxID=360054 RepID=UPI0009B5B866|nr:signal peptidase I [Bryobacter aggregatus]